MFHNTLLSEKNAKSKRLHMYDFHPLVVKIFGVFLYLNFQK